MSFDVCRLEGDDRSDDRWITLFRVGFVRNVTLEDLLSLLKKHAITGIENDKYEAVTSVPHQIYRTLIFEENVIHRRR